MARAGRARRPPDAGDEADRRRRAGDAVRDGRLRPPPPRRGPLERRRDRDAQGLQVDDVVTNFGDGPVRDSGPGATRTSSEEDFNPFDEARMLSRRLGGIRVVSLYAPNGRVVGSPFYDGKLEWFERLRALARRDPRSPAEPLILGGDFNVTPTDEDVWDAASRPRRHPRLGAGARGAPAGSATGASPTPTASPTRTRRAASAGGTTGPAMFHKNLGMRIDLLYASRSRSPSGSSGAEIDREARKGPPIPSDHAPVVLDLDEPRQGVRRRLGGCPRADRGADEAERQAQPGPGPLRRGARGAEQGGRLTGGLQPRPATSLADDHDPRHPAREPARRPDLQHPVAAHR